MASVISASLLPRPSPKRIEAAASARLRPRAASTCEGLPARQAEREQKQHEQSGHDRREEDVLEVDLHRQQGEREQRTDDGARVIHRTVKSESTAAICRVRGCRDQRVPGRGAEPFADAVQKPQQQHGTPGGRQPDQRARRVRQAIAGDHERFRVHATIRQPARDQLQHARGGFGKALDQADDRRSSAERCRQEDRQQRRTHFARGVVQE